MEMGFSFCSPTERFSRKKAHNIIKGRIATNKNITTIIPNKDSIKYESVVKMVKEVLNANVGTKEFAGIKLPTWFKGV